jgi:hypothetical protein
VVKAAAAKLGFDPATFGGHSLRSGLVTTAVKRGVNLMKVCDQTGHKSLEMLRVYTRDAELFAGNAAAGLLWRRVIGSHDKRKRCESAGQLRTWAPKWENQSAQPSACGVFVHDVAMAFVVYEWCYTTQKLIV